MSAPEASEVGALGLSGTRYTVEQTGTDENFRPEYEARDVTGETVFQCTHRMYEGKDTIPFVAPDGTALFSVDATDTWDIAGDYLLIDDRTGDELVVFENDLSILQDTWRIRDAREDTLLTEISSRGGLYTVGRKILPAGRWIGHRFDITDWDETHVGTIESDFAVFDKYEITLSDRSSIPLVPIVAATVVIDAIQQN